MGKRVVATRSSSAKRSCMVYASSMIMFLVMILSERVDNIPVGVCFVWRRGVCRGLGRVQVWFVLLLLTFPPTIGLARAAGLGSGIGWVVVDRVRILWGVGVGVVGICVGFFLLNYGLGMHGVWCVFNYFVRLCGGDRILGSGLCMLFVMGGVQESKRGVVSLRVV